MNILKGGATNPPKQPTNASAPPPAEKPPPGPPAAGQPPAAQAPGGATNKKNTKPKKMNVKLLTVFNLIPVFFHTFVKIMPVGLYLASFLESMLFNDIRGFFIFVGLLVNDLINIGYNYMMEAKPNINCAVVRNVFTDDFFSFSTPHTQYIAFVTSFLMTSMYFKKVFYYSTFFMFVVLIAMTVWSRITIGCKDILGAGFNLLFGALQRNNLLYIS